MAYTPKGYTDKASVEKYGLIDIDVQFNDQVNEFICAAENIIEQETNRDFSVTPQSGDPLEDTLADRHYDGDGSDMLYIDATKTVESVKLSPTGTALDADQYVVYPKIGTPKRYIKLLYLKFPVGNQNIVVNGAYGYAQVPADIKLAANALVMSMINESWPSDDTVSSMTVGRYTVSYKTSDTKHKTDLIGLQEIFDRNKKYTF